MNMKENNKYRYTDTAERNIRMNRFYIIASSLLAIVFLFYLWLKLVNLSRPLCSLVLFAIGAIPI